MTATTPAKYTPLVFMLSFSSLAFPSITTAAELLETLVVTGTKTSATTVLQEKISVREAQDFMPGTRMDVAEIITQLPGVQVDSLSNYAQDTRISLRGFGARSAFGVRGIDLQVDGVPLSTPDGQGQLSSVMLDNVSRVEVLRGPIAALYGNGAGGVITLQTAMPTATHINAGLAIGEHGLQRQFLQGHYRSDNIAVGVQIADLEIDGARPHSRAERQQAAAQIFYTFDNQVEFIIKHDASDDPLLQDPLGLTLEQWQENPLQLNSTAELFNTRKSVAHQQTSITLRERAGDTRWQAAVWQGERDIVQYLGFSGEALGGSGGVVDLARDFSGFSANLSQDFALLDLPATLSVGTEFAEMTDTRRGYVNNVGRSGALRRDEQGDVESRDGYVLLQLSATEKIHIFGGARYSDLQFDVTDYFIVKPLNPDDSGQRGYSEASFAFGVDYQLNNAWTLFASRGRGYETPTLTEMAYKTGATGLNTELAAAINQQYEWGVTYLPRLDSKISLTQFMIETENEIVVDQSLNGRTSYRNAAETERKGVELAADFSINPFLRTFISAQYLDAIYSTGIWQHKQLPGVAKKQYQAQIKWLPFGNEKFMVNVAWQYRAKIAPNDNNTIFAPAATTTDVAVQGNYDYPAWRFGWWIKSANITDENYIGSVIVNQTNGRSFEPALGRTISGGIQLGYTF